MSYFPHAYQKMLVATNATPFPSAVGATTALAAGQVGVVNALTNQTINIGATPVYGAGAGQFTQVYLAQGSFHLNDKIGPFHGGYKETVKSKGINPKFVSEFYVTTPASPVNHVIEVAQVNCNIKCDTMYDLRVDVKGSPALRFLSHNMYQTLSYNTGCCTFTGGVADSIDPNLVLLGWADQINGVGLTAGGNNSLPFLSQFIQAKVWNKVAATTATGSLGASTVTVAAAAGLVVGQKVKFIVGPNAYVAYISVIAGTTITLVNPDLSAYVLPVAVPAGSIFKAYGLITTATYVPQTGAAALTVDSSIDILGAYVGTEFGDCSFDPKDHFEKEPILIYASPAAYANNSNDLGGSTCDVSCFKSAIVQQGKQGKGFGETLVRELILSKRYQQEPWYQDPRMREVMNDTVIGSATAGGPEIARGTQYAVYYLLHSVPRKANPSGTFDNDQYLVKIVTPSRTAATAVTFEAWWNAFLTSAGSGVALKVVL